MYVTKIEGGSRRKGKPRKRLEGEIEEELKKLNVRIVKALETCE